MVSALCTDVMRAYWTSNTNCIVCATWNAESNTKFLTASKRAFPYSLKPRSEIFLIPAFAKRVIPYFCPCFCLLEPSVEAGYSFSLSSCMWASTGGHSPNRIFSKSRARRIGRDISGGRGAAAFARVHRPVPNNPSPTWITGAFARTELRELPTK